MIAGHRSLKYICALCSCKYCMKMLNDTLKLEGRHGSFPRNSNTSSSSNQHLSCCCLTGLPTFWMLCCW